MAFALAIVALTCLPYLFGLAITPPGFQYSGLLGNTDDQNVYLSYMRQAHDGRLLFTDQFTTEPQQPWFFHIFFLKLGLFSRVSGLSLILTYQLARVVCGVLLLLALYLLGARFLDNLRARRFFLIFVALASGFGWLYLVIFGPGGNHPHPPDLGPGLVMPELITFLTLLLNPLFCCAVLLLVATLLLFMAAVEKSSLRLALLAGLAAMLLANIHSYDMIPLAITIVAYLIARAVLQRRLVIREFAAGAIVGLMMLPPLLYQFHLYRDLPVFRLKAEVATLSPPVMLYLAALGLPLLLAIPGAWLALRRMRQAPDFILPVIWVIAILGSSYLPFPFQRKMAEGMQLPLVLLATLALSHFLFANPKINARAAALIGGLVVVVSFPSNALFTQRLLHDLQNMGADYYAYLMPPPYLRTEQVNTLRWLDGKVAADDGVFCNPMLGCYLPANTGARTYVGHWAETINYRQKLGALRDFLSGRMSPRARADLLQRENIKYLLIGPEERAIAPGAIKLAGLPLREVNRIGEITIFEVEQQAR